MAIRMYTNGKQLIGTPDAPFNINAQTPVTLCGWYYIDGTWPTTTISIFGVYMVGAIPGNPAFTAIQIGMRDGNIVIWTWNGGILIQTTGVSLPNTWIHVGYTYTGTLHSLYINGVLHTTSTNAQNPGTLDQTYINGYPGGGVNESGNVLLDDFQLYQRALLQSEIQTICQSYGTRHGVYNSLKASYEFQEQYSNNDVVIVRDISGNNADLIPVGVGTTPTYTNGCAGSNARHLKG